ncbi:MAG: MerR family transcriptional regulator [Thermomicrobiales bacterium]
MERRNYRSGQFAQKTAVSVRTLRFYDKVGLLSPAKRSESGYRLYGDADLVRLQHILALKFLGFSLDEIRAFLANSPLDFREALAQQRAMLRERRAQLDAVIAAIERAQQLLATNEADECDWETLANLIKEIQMEQHNSWHKKYFTDEQLETMQELGEQSYTPAARAKLESRGPWTEADQQRVDAQYAALYAGVRRATTAGEEPGGAAGQALAGDAIGLLEAFTGGDPEVWAGLQQWWKNHADLPAQRRMMQIPLTDAEATFLEQAKAIYLQRRQGAVGA